MTGNFFESETKENLMRAFAGESQGVSSRSNRISTMTER